MWFETKDSGAREEFSTGSKRDTNEWKSRFDLVSPYALSRIADLMARWAQKYWERNRELGQPKLRFIESWLRHFYQYIMWDTSEDHLAAVCFNVMAIMHFEETGADWF